MARITAFSRQIDIAKSRLTGAARQQMMARLAVKARDEALDQDTRILGSPPPYKTIVDGQQGAPETQVRSGGTIVYLFAVGGASLKEAADETYKLLLETSPVLTGKYRSRHIMLVNGVERDAAAEGAEITFAEDDVVSFTNLLPYSRRIERGWSNQAPNGVYESVAATIRARFGNLLKIGFSYDRYPGFGIGSARRGGRVSTRADLDRSERFPTIRIQVK